MNRFRLPPFFLALCLHIVAGQPNQSADGSITGTRQELGVTVTYLANEGFLLRAGSDAVLIDAFVAQPYTIYAAIPERTYEMLVKGEPPFAGIALALTSHIHGDHFQPKAAVQFLKNRKQTQFISSLEVCRAILEQDGAASLRDRVRGVLPEPGKTQSVEHQGIKIDFFQLRHGSEKFYKLQNLGHLIYLGGAKILHIGDAEMREENFSVFDLPSKEIDIALVPYWFYLSERGRRIIERQLISKIQIAVHIPPADLTETEIFLREHHPAVYVFRESMEARAF